MTKETPYAVCITICKLVIPLMSTLLLAVL